MKKSITLLIGLTFLLTILLVGLFGSTIFANEELMVEKVTSVEVTNTDITSENRKVLYMAGNSQITYQISWLVLPDNATNKNIDFIITVDESRADRIQVNASGLVTFFGKVTASVTVRSKDGTNKSDFITFIVIQTR